MARGLYAVAFFAYEWSAGSMTELITILGNRLRELREYKGLTRIELASLAGMESERYKLIEQGKADLNVQELNELALALSVSMSKLVHDL